MDNIITNEKIEKYKKKFLDENSKLNLISKNDEKYLYEKHIYDSLSIKLFFEKYNYIPKTLLDIGTGGGFPSIPIAIAYPQIEVTGVDSIKKKITALQDIVSELKLNNINFIHSRVEEIKDVEFDVITARAVATLDTLIKYAYPLLKKGGYMVFYKSKKSEEEMNAAYDLIKKSGLKIMPEITYRLPLEEDYTRRLVILKK